MSYKSQICQKSTLSLAEQLAYAQSLCGIALKIHGDESRTIFLKRSIKFILNGLRHRHDLQELQDAFTCPDLSEVLRHFPIVLEKPFQPYVCANWNLPERVAQVRNHYTFVKELFGAKAAEIYMPEGSQLFEFESMDGEIHSIELFPGYKNEGSMGIRLCDSDKNEIYSLSFHLSNITEKTLCIGALQGPNERVPERQQKIVLLTKSAFGLRPKALMIEVMYMVADALRIESIYAISNQYHIYKADYFSDDKRSSVYFDGDSFWREYQAIKTSEAFYKFPDSIIRKNISSIKSKKRGLYRKRYDWLEEVSKLTEKSMAHLLVPLNDKTTSDLLWRSQFENHSEGHSEDWLRAA